MDTDDVGGLADLLSNSRARAVVGAIGCYVAHSNPPVNENSPVIFHHRAVVDMREEGRAATLRYL